MSALRQKINKFRESFLDLVYPPKCVICDVKTDSPNLFCFKCWNTITFISDPRCNKCGIPFPVEMGKNARCHYCVDDIPSFDKARSIMRFDTISEKIIHNFKYYEKTEFATNLARMMILNGRDMVDEADFVTAVPMHIEKLRKRGYNQAAILAANIAKLANKELLPDLILKHKPSKSQSGLDRIQRKENVKNTFMINPIYKDTIFRKKILLVDDVLTTGATASECAKILRNNRCKRTYLLTVARTF